MFICSGVGSTTPLLVRRSAQRWQQLLCPAEGGRGRVLKQQTILACSGGAWRSWGRRRSSGGGSTTPILVWRSAQRWQQLPISSRRRERKGVEAADHGLINYKDTKTECRLYWCLREFKRYSQSCWYFRPSFVNCCPSSSNLLSGSTLPPPSLCQSTVYTDSVWLGGGGGVESCWRSYSAGV